MSERTDALLEANRNLQQQIAQRELIEQQLRDARDAAQAANRSSDKYLAAASHDLLQPLNAARLLISTLRERQLPTAEHVLVERTHQALEGAEDLLTDLLDISRLDQAEVRPDLAPYRLDELLAPLVSEFQSVAGAVGLELRVRFGDEAVLTDLRLMTRILRNLLSNACRYNRQGRCSLGCTASGRAVEPGSLGHRSRHCRRLLGVDIPGVQSTGRRTGGGPQRRGPGAGDCRTYRPYPWLPGPSAFPSGAWLGVQHRGATVSRKTAAHCSNAHTGGRRQPAAGAAFVGDRQ